MNARRPENHLRRALRSLKDIDIELQNGSSLVENNICKTIFHSYESFGNLSMRHLLTLNLCIKLILADKTL